MKAISPNDEKKVPFMFLYYENELSMINITSFSLVPYMKERFQNSVSSSCLTSFRPIYSTAFFKFRKSRLKNGVSSSKINKYINKK